LGIFEFLLIHPKKTPTKPELPSNPKKNTPQPYDIFLVRPSPPSVNRFLRPSDAAFEAAAMAWHPTTKYYCFGLGTRDGLADEMSRFR